MLDIFKQDAFSLVSLTEAMRKAQYVPGRIGATGIFQSSGITTTTAVIEEVDGELNLIQSSPRGGHTPAHSTGSIKRKVRSFVAPHLEEDSKIMADEVQGIRAFGSEDATEAVQMKVDERLARLRQKHEVTLEHMRASALQGNVLDADGSVIFNLFTEFGVSQQTVELDMGVGDDVRSQTVAIQRLSEYALGSEPISGFRAFCGDTFFDTLIAADQVKEALKYQESVQLRNDPRMGFEFGGVVWENYRGRVGATSVASDLEASATPFFADAEAYVVPIGPMIYKTYYAPADFIETVNTVGLPIYAKVVFDPELNRWVKIHSQSNPCVLVTRPRAVIKLTIGT